jgi:hypothetical protein
MGFLTLIDLEAIARKKAQEIVSLFRTHRPEAFEAAILYGTLVSGGHLEPDEPVEFRLLLIDRQRSPQQFGNQADLLGQSGAIPFTSPNTFLIPTGPLHILVIHPSDFEHAADNLHPEAVALFRTHDVLYTKSEEVKHWLANQLRTVKQQLRRQRTA